MSWGGLVSALLIFSTFLHGTCEGVCSSSCGNVTNITSPFRLQSDPSSCGDPNYELSCENNQPIWNLLSRDYEVLAISYDNQTVRVLDPSFESSNCSSLPKYSLERNDFPSDTSYTLVMDSYNYINYVSCLNSIDDPSYISMSPCINSSSGSYYYVLIGNPTFGDIKASCSTISRVPSDLTVVGNSSYLNIWTSLLMGFELSWRPALCDDCESAGGDCSYRYEYDPYEVCYNPCRSAFQSKHCFIHYLKEAAEGFGVEFITKTGYVLAGRSALGILCLFSFIIYELRKRYLSKNNDIEQFLEEYRNLTPTRFTYGEIKKMTRGLKEKLGQGGFGTVFKGTLASGWPVAIKMLGKSRANGEEFINEVATIGRIHHVNVVKLVGFCSEGSKKALVYDYMPNGSLDKYIYSKEGQTSSTLTVEKMYEIALGAARGIQYLHQGCDMQILHFDIKPHNILLDADFTPKVSDFGLAKLYPTEHSKVSVSAAKGTIGYIAPELIYRNFGSISYKSDVYSFGRLLVEMIGRRKNMEVSEDDSSLMYFPEMIYDRMFRGEATEVDTAKESESELARKLLVVGLWCVQMTPNDRPSMHRVVEMLEGSVEDIPVPPRPSLAFPSMGNFDSSLTAESSEELQLLDPEGQSSSYSKISYVGEEAEELEDGFN